MVSRMYFNDREQAIAIAESIDAAGLEVAVITEREPADSPTDDEDALASYLVASPASAGELANFVPADVEIVED